MTFRVPITVCVICGTEVPTVRVAALQRAQREYVVSQGKWTIEGSATCSTECNRERKRRYQNEQNGKVGTS